MGAVRYRINVDKDRYTQNETVQVYASAYDPNYLPRKEERLVVFVEPPEGTRQPLELQRDRAREGYYLGNFSPTLLGSYRIWAGEEDESTRASDRFDVFVPNLEEANPNLDLDLLRKIADSSHQASSSIPPVSQFYSLDRISQLAHDIEQSEMILREFKEDELWDAPLVYLLFALLITAEWISRKVFRML